LTNSSVSAYTPYRNRKLCGTKATPHIIGFSNCDSLTLNFVTDSSLNFGGFQLRYTITPAGKWSVIRWQPSEDSFVYVHLLYFKLAISDLKDQCSSTTKVNPFRNSGDLQVRSKYSSTLVFILALAYS